MPLVKSQSTLLDQVAVWKMDENEFREDTAHREITGVFNRMHQHRILQRKACFHLVSIMAGSDAKVWYDQHGKPHLMDDPRQISFSHSGSYAAVMLSKNKAGIDFERMRSKVLRITHKFLNETELNSLSSAHEIEHAHIYWGAKESIYKAYGKQQLLFKENICIQPFDFISRNGYFKARLMTPEQEEDFTLYYEILEDHMMVHLINEH